MLKNNSPVKMTVLASMSPCWPGGGRREKSFCSPLCYPKSPLLSTPCAAPAFLPHPPAGEKTREDRAQRDTMPSGPSGTAPTPVPLTPLWDSAEDRDGSDSDSSATDGRAMARAPTSNAALGPPCQRGTWGQGLAFFLFCFFKNRKAYCG